MNQELLRPSLQNYEKERVYYVYEPWSMFYVAFFGGIIPTIALGTKNLRWLKVDKPWVNILMGVGFLFLLSKVGFVVALTKGLVQADRSTRHVFKALAVLLFLGYYYLTKERYTIHRKAGGQKRPMLKDAIIWIVIGIGIEVGLGMLGVLLV